MNLKEKISELRRLIPIPISKAKDILEYNNGNVALSFEKIKTEYLQELEIISGYKTEEIEPVYVSLKYDFDKTLGHFKRIEEDKNFDFRKLSGITGKVFKSFGEFLKIENQEGLLYAILMKEFTEIESFLNIHLELSELAEILSLTRNEYLKSQNKDTFKQDYLYKKALDNWEKSQIKLENNYLILQRNLDKKRKHNNGYN